MINLLNLNKKLNSVSTIQNSLDSSVIASFGSVVLSAVVLGSVLLCFVVLTIAIVAYSETLHDDKAPNLSLLFSKSVY